MKDVVKLHRNHQIFLNMIILLMQSLDGAVTIGMDETLTTDKRKQVVTATKFSTQHLYDTEG